MIARALLDRLRLRARCYALRVATVDRLERERDAAIDVLAEVSPELDDALARAAARVLAAAGRSPLADRATLTNIERTLLATGHPVRDDLVRAVDDAIDRERCKGQDFVEHLAELLGWVRFDSGEGPVDVAWPCDNQALLRDVERRLQLAHDAAVQQ